MIVCSLFSVANSQEWQPRFSQPQHTDRLEPVEEEGPEEQFYTQFQKHLEGFQEQHYTHSYWDPVQDYGDMQFGESYQIEMTSQKPSLPTHKYQQPHRLENQESQRYQESQQYQSKPYEDPYQQHHPAPFSKSNKYDQHYREANMPSYPKVTYKQADKMQQAQESQLYDNQYNTYTSLFDQDRTFGDSGSSLPSEGRDRYAW